MDNSNFDWLMKWFLSQCDNDWEHGNGVSIGTLDNPGWYIKIPLNETELNNKSFSVVDTERSESDWIYCSVKNKMFQGFGGPLNLIELVEIFKRWVESHQEHKA